MRKRFKYRDTNHKSHEYKYAAREWCSHKKQCLRGNNWCGRWCMLVVKPLSLSSPSSVSPVPILVITYCLSLSSVSPQLPASLSCIVIIVMAAQCAWRHCHCCHLRHGIGHMGIVASSLSPPPCWNGLIVIIVIFAHSCSSSRFGFSNKRMPSSRHCCRTVRMEMMLRSWGLAYKFLHLVGAILVQVRFYHGRRNQTMSHNIKCDPRLAGPRGKHGIQMLQMHQSCAQKCGVMETTWNQLKSQAKMSESVKWGQRGKAHFIGQILVWWHGLGVQSPPYIPTSATMRLYLLPPPFPHWHIHPNLLGPCNPPIRINVRLPN